MFLNFYGLREQPFGVTPDPRFLYLGQTHREVLSSLVYGIESDRGFLGLIAGPGMGKTTLLFQLLNRFRNVAKTAFIFQTQCNSRELLRHILNDFGVQTADIRDDTVMLHQAFNDLLTREVRAGRKCLVIVDEAQDLKPPALEALRLLSNFETPRNKLVQIVISGQMLLAERLAEPSMSQLLQRISSMNRLLPMSDSDVSQYIDHRLHVAGFKGGSLFTPQAREMIALKSEGVPRRINGLCFNAMSLGYATMAKRIDEYMIDEVAADLALPEPSNDAGPAQRRAVQGRTFCMSDHGVDRTTQDIQKRLDPDEALNFRLRGGPKSTADDSPMVIHRALVPEAEGTELNGIVTSTLTDKATEDAPDGRAQDSNSTEDLFELRARVSQPRLEKRRNPLRNLWHFTFIAAVLLATAVVLRPHGGLDALFDSSGVAAKKAAPPTTVPATPVSDNGQLRDTPAPGTGSNPPESAIPHRSSASSPSARTDASRRGRDKRDRIEAHSTLTLNTTSTMNRGEAVPTKQVNSPLSTSMQSIPASGEHAMPQASLQGQQTSPELISMVRPTYPLTVTGARVTGTVVLEAVVDPTGNVERVNVIEGDSRLVPAAVSALKQWKYVPSYRNGVPVESVTTVSINISPSE